MKRRSTSEARQALLDAAADQVRRYLESPDMDRTLAFLDLHEVSAAAGYRGTSMIYSLWGDPPDGHDDGLTARERFSLDVIADSAARSVELERLSERILESVEDLADLEPAELVRSFANSEFRRYARGGVQSTWQMSYLWAMTMTSHQDMRARLTEVHGDEMIDGLADAYVGSLGLLGRKLKPTVDGRMLAVLLRAMINGLLIEEVLETVDGSEEFEWAGSGGWTLFAVGAHALMTEFTEPLEPEE